jgi:hypothetical protein
MKILQDYPKVILFIFIVFSSCKKDPKDSNTIPLKVVEPLSEIPVKDAQVIFFECTAGCIGSTIHFTGLTDENGVCNVPSGSFNNYSVEMNIYKEGYWPFLIPAQRSQKATLSPEGWVKLLIHTDTNYPSGSQLIISIAPKRLEYGYGDYLTNHAASQDSTLLIKGYGGELNRINWQIVNANFELLDYDELEVEVPRFDTSANVILNY